MALPCSDKISTILPYNLAQLGPTYQECRADEARDRSKKLATCIPQLGKKREHNPSPFFNIAQKRRKTESVHTWWRSDGSSVDSSCPFLPGLQLGCGQMMTPSGPIRGCRYNTGWLFTLHYTTVYMGQEGAVFMDIWSLLWRRLSVVFRL